MGEGQTGSMQQVAESGSWDGALPCPPLPPSWSARPVAAPRAGNIDRAIQSEVLPRLSVAHTTGTPSEVVDPSRVDAFVDCLLRTDHTAQADEFVEDALGRGVPVEHVFLRLFQPAARRLGELWLDDLCGFVDVTLATATMQTLLRRLGPAFHRQGRRSDGRRSILLTTLPGDQHTFGANMAAEFFRCNGWDVFTTKWTSAEALGTAVRSAGTTVVGFSASCETRLDHLAAAIGTVRRTCKDRLPGILVGGPLFVSDPGYAIRVGADAVGLDGRQAVAEADNLARRAGY